MKSRMGLRSLSMAALLATTAFVSVGHAKLRLQKFDGQYTLKQLEVGKSDNPHALRALIKAYTTQDGVQLDKLAQSSSVLYKNNFEIHHCPAQLFAKTYEGSTPYSEATVGQTSEFGMGEITSKEPNLFGFGMKANGEADGLKYSSSSISFKISRDMQEYGQGIQSGRVTFDEKTGQILIDSRIGEGELDGGLSGDVTCVYQRTAK